MVWYDFRSFWNRSDFYPNHEADLLRMVLLHTRGGVYIDTDVIFTRSLPAGSRCSTDFIGIEAGGPSRATAERVAPSHGGGVRLTGADVVCNAVMAFEPGAAFLAAAIDEFYDRYTPFPPKLSFPELLALGVWGAMGPSLLTRAALERPESLCVVERERLYPISPLEAASAFGAWHEARDRSRWDTIASRSLTVHYWNQLTKHLSIACGSLMHRLLDQHCVVCTPLLCTTAR